MTNSKRPDAIEHFSDSARGMTIPQHFVESRADGWTGISVEDDAILRAGPDHEDYWDAWDTVLNTARYESHGHTWYLHQDGDLWALCAEIMSEEERDNFGLDSES